jgi:methylthioribose-1-phosphate isomerase
MVLPAPSEALPATLAWQQESLYLLDQTRLPQAVVVERVSGVEDVWRWIHELRVRGAPAIGVAAAYGLCVAMQPLRHLSCEDFRSQLMQQAGFLDSARPTAVNLSWSLSACWLLRNARLLKTPAPSTRCWSRRP